MKMINLNSPLLVLFLISSCQINPKDELILDGDLEAKQVLEVQCDFVGSENSVFEWSLSDSVNGEWEKLPGINGERIILLNSYVGHYIRCEIINSDENGKPVYAAITSSKPIEYNGNRNTDWLHDAGFGIMVHYLKPAIVPEGSSNEWNNAVDKFNTDHFASQANEAGVGFVMFTLGQNSGYYCSPNATFDRIVGVGQGELCSNRDLPMDLLNSLNKYDIPLILYLPSNPPNSNKLVDKKFRYPYGKDSATSPYNQAILENMIREWSLRYGEKLKGWWFDGLYEWNNIRSTRVDMSMKHNISTHTLAAKAGNKESIVTYNSGFGKIRPNTSFCDYSSGEKKTIDETPSNRWVSDGTQWFLFTYLGEKWGGKGNQFDTDSLVGKAKKIVVNGGVLCLEVVTNSMGEILPQHYEQIFAIGQELRK